MKIEISLPFQIIIFLVSGLAIWYFCNKLSDVVEYVDAAFGLGDAFGGTLILSVITNLPEIAIAVSGAIQRNYDLVAGNLLGGIALQTMLLIIFDFANKSPHPLSTLISSKAGIFQGISLLIILSLCFIAGIYKETTTPLGAGISVWLVLIVWVSSLFYLKKIQKKSHSKVVPFNTKYTKKTSLWWLAGISVIVLFFGVLLERSSDAIANHFHLSGMFFGATFLAFVTSLPEISSGLEFLKNKDYEPIISDIFGGNGFLPVLFLPASIIANQNIITNVGYSNNFLALLSILLASIFILGMWRKTTKKYEKLGWDNWLMLLIGILGFTILYYISK